MSMANVSSNARGPNATYIPPARVRLVLGQWAFALGLWGFALGLGGFSDTNMLVSPMRNARVGSLDQREGIRVAVEYRLKNWNSIQNYVYSFGI